MIRRGEAQSGWQVHSVRWQPISALRWPTTPNPGLLLGLAAMMRPENYEQRTGLYMLEPYDPDRIPVIFVHGLLSIPRMWVPTVTAVESDPALRGRYQFWAFAYPTGDPIALSALRLRESLAQVYQLYPKTKDVVLISHSTGRVDFPRMQAVTTRRVLWDRVFRGSRPVITCPKSSRSTRTAAQGRKRPASRPRRLTGRHAPSARHHRSSAPRQRSRLGRRGGLLACSHLAGAPVGI